MKLTGSSEIKTVKVPCPHCGYGNLLYYDVRYGITAHYVFRCKGRHCRQIASVDIDYKPVK